MATSPAAPERARRRACGICGWDWIGVDPLCPACGQEREQHLPIRLVGWVPGQLEGSLWLYGASGAFLGGVEYRDGTWAAFAKAPLGVFATPTEGIAAVEAATGYTRPSVRAGRWLRVEEEPRAAWGLYLTDGTEVGRISIRRARYQVVIGELVIGRREALAPAQRLCELVLNVCVQPPPPSLPT